MVLELTSFQENFTFTTSLNNADESNLVGALDQLIASGLRLWMLLAMVFAVLLLMMIMICCFIKLRIPRTKREIELDAALRRKRRIFNTDAELKVMQARSRSAKVIVMSSLRAANQSLLSNSSGGMEADFDTASKHSKDRRRSEGSKGKI